MGRAPRAPLLLNVATVGGFASDSEVMDLVLLEGTLVMS